MPPLLDSPSGPVALVENVYYIRMLESHNIVVWIVRGLGTAVMHGGMTAIYGIITRAGRSQRRTLDFMPAGTRPRHLRPLALQSSCSHRCCPPSCCTSFCR
jgi:hypothetical protein